MKSIAAAVAAGLVFAAYSGAANAQISDDVVKIGVLTDMSSLYADATGKGSLVAVQMAVADFGGKVKGKPIEVVSGDHQNKPDVGVSIARNWIDNDKVDSVFDVPTSSVALAVSTLLTEKNKIFMNSGAGSSDLTGKACSPIFVHYTYDTYALSNVAGKAMVKRGEDTWFFITADYAFGAALERDAADVVKESGGKVLGDVRHPLNTSDFSSFLLQAQASKAKVVALANAGGDTDQRTEAGRRIRPDEGRPEADRVAAPDHRRAFDRPQGRPGPDPHRRLLLGPGRRRRAPSRRSSLRRSGTCRP